MLDLDALPPEILPALEALATALATHIRAHVDAPLDAHEQGVLAAWDSARGAALTGVVQAATTGIANPHRPQRLGRAACPGCGRRCRPQSRRGRSRTLLTRLGPIAVERAWHHCRACRAGWAPADRALGLAPRQRTGTGLQRGEAALGARLPFAEGRDQPVPEAVDRLVRGPHRQVAVGVPGQDPARLERGGREARHRHAHGRPLRGPAEGCLHVAVPHRGAERLVGP